MVTLGFTTNITDEKLQSAIESGTWGDFDETITQLAERTLNDEQIKLKLELHACGSASVELFPLLFPKFVKKGNLEVFKSTYIWTGSTLRPFSFPKRGA